MSKLYLEPYSGEEIQKKRLALGYSQPALAELVGTHGNTLSHVEVGRNNSVPLRMLLTIILDDLETMKMMKEDEEDGSNL